MVDDAPRAADHGKADVGLWHVTSVQPPIATAPNLILTDDAASHPNRLRRLESLHLKRLLVRAGIELLLQPPRRTAATGPHVLRVLRIAVAHLWRAPRLSCRLGRRHDRHVDAE